MPPDYKKFSELEWTNEVTIGDYVAGFRDIGFPPNVMMGVRGIRDLFDAHGLYHRFDNLTHADDDEFVNGPDEFWFPISGSDYTDDAAFVSDNGALTLDLTGALTGSDPTTDLCALVKPISGEAGNCLIETACFGAGKETPAVFTGLCFSDGLDPETSNFAAAGIFYGHTSPSGPHVVTYEGTLDAMTITAVPIHGHIGPGPLFIRLDWSAEDTFTPYFSGTNWNYNTFGVNPITLSMDPTHYGLAFGWTDNSRGCYSWEYFRNRMSVED